MSEHVPALGLSYEIVETHGGASVRFEDGVEYTIPEAVHIARVGATDDDLRVLHQVKKIFDGEMIVGKEQERTHRLTIPRCCSVDVSEAWLAKAKERARERTRRENEDWWKRKGYR